MLKYAYLVLSLAMEIKFDDVRVRVASASRGYLRSDWPTLVESLIFTPTIILDGMMINVEWFLSDHRDLGDVFDYDSVILLVLDIVLFVKLFVGAARETHTDAHGRVDLAALIWAMIQSLYDGKTIKKCFFF